MSQDLLIEIGCEEIPARFIDQAVTQLGNLTEKWLDQERIQFRMLKTYATPRRLAVLVKEVAQTQADQTEEVRGPALRIAQAQDGSWSPAAQGFARKQGVTVDELEIREHKGEKYIFAIRHEVGISTSSLVQSKFVQVLQAIQFPSTMRWGDRHRFVRPIRWLVALYGEEMIPLKWAGLEAGRQTVGHRFLGKEISLSSASCYVEALAAESVIVDVKERKEKIVAQIEELARQYDCNIPIDPGLLQEVTHLVEYPTALVGSFDQKFLVLPKKVLTTTMREHQRYFPVENTKGELLPLFVTVRNGDKRSLELVKRGNEKVLQARLADAQFFYLEDRKLSIDAAVKQLDRIIFREKLGSMGDRVRRIYAIVTELGERFHLDQTSQKQLQRAAHICKFDLATQMVDEFSKLEGYMGYIYAKEAGEDERVARAIDEHHAPRTANDQLPTDILGALLSLADKMDTIAASFGIGVHPSGSQDPYGLRRRALGVVQILLDQSEIELTYHDLIQISLRILEQEELLKEDRSKVELSLLEFFRMRVRSIQLEQQIRYDVVDALLKNDQEPLSYRFQKAAFLEQKLGQEQFKWEVEAFTRTANIVQSQKAQVAQLLPEQLTEPAEKELYEALLQAEVSQRAADQAQNPEAAYQAIQKMAPVIHRFFDQILVMVEDEAIRTNRLALLKSVMDCTISFANFQEIVFPQEESVLS
ncbi:glycyl-tRNA synthetase beta chain [Seinonella peptonophila]|uniref:Glycine--tRNA ligase beta subunit n=1 Tax=Seinonella peptonophila TaxID=112248 RepID=A0A1M4V714_9BACL|nr:glycine--tRNA ligase subunit beta [Seinonella peptonophila]SHE64653.1 glycyl-tRNA synthetase beta chain [Seinonella peptonophila]